MTKKKNEESLAEYYNQHGIDPDEWETSESVTPPTRRQVTLSVRFSEEEITAIRQAAQRAGNKPTAFIRAQAIAATKPLTIPTSKAINDAINTLARDLDHLRQIAHTK